MPKKIVIETKTIDNGAKNINKEVGAVVSKAIDRMSGKIEKSIKSALQKQIAASTKKESYAFKLDPKSITDLAVAIAKKSVSDKKIDLSKLSNASVEKLLKDILTETKSGNKPKQAGLTKNVAQKILDVDKLKTTIISAVSGSLKSEISILVKDMGSVASEITKAAKSLARVTTNPGRPSSSSSTSLPQVKAANKLLNTLGNKLDTLSRSVELLSRNNKTTPDTGKDLAAIATSVKGLRTDIKGMMNSFASALATKAKPEDDSKYLKELIKLNEQQLVASKELGKKLDAIVITQKQASTNTSKAVFKTTPKLTAATSIPVSTDALAEAVKKSAEDLIATQSNYIRKNLNPAQVKSLDKLKDAISSSNLQGIHKSLEDFGNIFTKAGVKQAEKIKGSINNFVATISKTVNGMEAIGSEFKRLNTALETVDAEIDDIKKKVAASVNKLSTTPTARLSSQSASVRQMTPSTFKSISDNIKVHKLKTITPKKGASQKVQAKQFNSIIEQSTAESIAGLEDSLHELQTYIASTLKSKLEKTDFKLVEPKDMKEIADVFSRTKDDKMWISKIANVAKLKKATGIHGIEDLGKLIDEYKKGVAKKITDQYTATDAQLEGIGKWIKTAPAYKPGAGIDFDYSAIQKKFNKAPEVSTKMMAAIKKAAGGNLKKVFEQTFVSAKVAMDLEVENIIKSVALPTIKSDKASNPFLETKLGSKRAVPKFATYTSGFEGFNAAVGKASPSAAAKAKEMSQEIAELGFRPKGADLLRARKVSKDLFRPAFGEAREGTINRFTSAATPKAAELARVGAIGRDSKAIADFENKVNNVAKEFQEGGAKANKSFDEFTKAMEAVGVTAYDAIRTFEQIATSNLYDKMLDTLKANKAIEGIGKKPTYDRSYRTAERTIRQVEQFAPVVGGGKPRRGAHQSNVVQLSAMTGSLFEDLDTSEIAKFHKNTITSLNRRLSELTKESDILLKAGRGAAAKTPVSLTNISSLGLPEEQASVMLNNVDRISSIMGDAADNFEKGIDELAGIAGVTIKMHADDLTALAPFGRQFQQPGRNISNISNASAITYDEMQRAGLRGAPRPELPTLRSAAENKLIQAGKYGGESQGYGYNVIAELRNTAGTFEDQILVSGKMAKALTAVTKNLVVAASAGPAGKGADQLESGVLSNKIGKAAEDFAQTIGAQGYKYKGRADKALLHDVKTSMVVNQGKSIEVQSAKVAEIFLNTFGRKLTTRYGSKGVSVTPTGDSSLAGIIKEFAGDKTKIKIGEAGLGVAKMPKSMGKLVSELLTSSKSDTDLGMALEESGNKFVLDMFKDASSSGILVEEEARYEQMLYEKAKTRLDSLYGVNLGSDVAGVGQIKSLYGQEVSKEGLIEVKPIDVRISSHGLAKRGLQPELLETIMGNVTGGAKKTTLKTDVPNYKDLLGTGGTLSKASTSLGYTGSVTKGGRGLDELTMWAKNMSEDQHQRLIDLEKNSSYYVNIIDELGKERQSIVGPKFMQIIEESGANPAWSPKQIEAREKGIKLNLPAYAAYETIFGQGSDFMKSINTDIYASNKEQWEYIKALQASMKGSNTEVAKVLSSLDSLDISEFKKQPERLGTFDKGAADSLLSTVSDTEKFAKAYRVALPTAKSGVTEDFYLPGPSIRQATPDDLQAGTFGMSKTARDLQNVIDAAKDVESARAGDIAPGKLKESYRVRTLSQKYTPEGTEFIKKGLKELGSTFKFHEGTPVTKGVFEGARGALKTKINELDVEDPGLADRLKALDPNIGDAEITHNLERLESSKLAYYEGLAQSVLGKGKGIEQAVFQKRIPAAMGKAVTAIVDKTDDFKKFQSAIADIKGDLPAEFQSVLEEAAKGIEIIGQEHAENISRYKKLKVPVLKQHEIGIHKKQAAKIPGLDATSDQDQYVESVRFPFTGTSSVQPYKAKILEGKEYENVFAVPGVPEMDLGAFEEQIGKVQGVRTDLVGQREEAWKAGEREEAEKLTGVIEALNHAISEIIPKYVAQAQKLDFDGDAIQVHSATTKEAREDIKAHFDKLIMDVSSTAAVFRDKFTGDASQKSTGKYMIAEMAMAFDKKFTSEKGFKFLEAPAITKDLEYLSSKEKIGILGSSYATEGSKNPMGQFVETITAEIGSPKHAAALDTLLSKYGNQTTTVESLDMAISKLDDGLKALVRGFITSEVHAVKFGDAVEAQLFKIHTGPETEGMTRMQRVFENRMGTGPGMISEGNTFAKERTTQINELLRFGIQKGMDVKHAGGPTVASDIIDAMTEPDVKMRESKLDDLMMQIKERSGSYGELEDFRQANEQALRGQLGAKDLDQLKTFVTSILKKSDEVTGTGKRSNFSVKGISDRSVLIDKAVEVLGFEGFMEDLQLALAAEISQTQGNKKSIQKRAREADPLYTLRTSGARLGTVGGGKTREERLANAVKEVEKALLATTKEINSEGKRQGAYVKSVEGSLTTSATRESFLKDFQTSVGDKYTPTPSASGADMVAKIFSDDLPDTIRQILEASNPEAAGKIVSRATSAAGVARTAEWREDELRFASTAPLSAQASKKFSGLLGEGGKETDEYKKAVQDFIETWQERILTLNKIDKVLDIIKSDASDYIATVGVSSKVTAPSTTTMSQEQVLRAAGKGKDKYNIASAFQERSSDSSAAVPHPPRAAAAPEAGISAGMPVGTGKIVDVRLVDITSAVLSMIGTGVGMSEFEAKAQDMARDPNSEHWLDFNNELRKRAEEIKSGRTDFIGRESDIGADPNLMGGPAIAKQRAAVKEAAEAASEYDYLEAAPRVSSIKGPEGTFENLKELHAQARDFLDKARGISFAKEAPTINPEIKKLIEQVGESGPNYKDFFNTVDELKQAATIEGSDAFKAFKLYKLAVGDFYIAKAAEAKQLLDAADTQTEKQKHYTNFTGFIDKFQTSIRSGLGKQSDIYTQDKRYVSPNLARGAGVYMSPAQIGQKAAAPLPEDQKIYDIYKGIIGDTGGGEFMKAPIEKAREAVKALSSADDEMIKLMESGEIMERIGSDIKEAWDFKGLSDNISRLREALELYKKYSVSEDSMAAERKNIDSVVKYLKNVEDIYTKIDTSKAVTQGPAKWGETGVIKVPTWLDPEQQLGLHKRNVQKIKEYYTKASSEGGAKIGERQEYKSQVRGAGGEILSNKVTDFHKYAESLDNAGDAIGRYSAKERDLTEIMQGSTRNFGAAITRAVKWGAASSIVYGGFQQLRSAIDTMADIETSLAQLRMVMNPLGADFGALGDSAVMFAKKYGVGVDDTLQSMKVFAQQGLSQAEIIDRTNTSTLASNVSTLSATDATEALTAAMKIFGNEADSSMKYLDAWSEVEARHAITAEDMANAIKKSASAAKNAGVTFDQLNGIVAAIGSTTRQSGKEVGTSMRFIFRRLSSDKGPKELAKLQVPTLTGEGELRSGFDVLGDLAMKWKDLTSAQKINTAQAIGGTRQYNSLLVLMDNWDQALQAVKDSTNSKGSAERKNAEIMKTYTKQLEQTRAAAVELQMAFGKVVLPGFKAGLNVTRTLLETISAIPDPIKAAAAGSVLFLTYLSKGADIIDAIKGGLGGVGGVIGGLGKALKEELDMAKVEVLGGKGVSPLISTGLSTLGKPVMKEVTGPDGKKIMEPQKQTLHEFQSSLGKTMYLIKEMGMTYNSVIGSMAVSTGSFVEKFGEKAAAFGAGLGYGSATVRKAAGEKYTFEEASGKAASLGLSGKAIKDTLAKKGLKGLGSAVAASTTLAKEMAALGTMSAGIVIDKFGEKLGSGAKKVAEDWAKSNSGLVEAIGPLAATTLLLAPALKSVYGHYIGLTKTAKDYKESIYGVKRTQEEELSSIRNLIGEYSTLKMKMDDITKVSDPSTKVRRQELGTYESPLLSTAKIYSGAKTTANELAESNANLVVGYDALGNAILRTSDNFQQFLSVVEKSKLKEIAKTDVSVAAKYIDELTTTEGPEQWKYGIKQFVNEIPVIGDMLAKGINVSPAKMLKVMTDNLNKALGARSKNPMATAIDKDIKDYQAQLSKIRTGFQSSYADFRTAVSDISTKGLDANEITNIFSAPELRKGWELMLEVEPTLNTDALRGKTTWQDLLGSEVLGRANQGANLGFTGALTKAQLETAGGTSRKDTVRSNDIVTFLDSAADDYNIAGSQAIVKLKETTDGVFEWVAQYFNTKTLKIEERAFDEDIQSIVDGIFPQQAIQEDLSERIEALNEFVAGAGAGLRGIDKKTFKKDFSLGERFYSDITTSTLLQSDKGFTPGAGGGFGPVDFQSDWAESFKQFYAKPMEEYKNKLANIDKLRLAGLDGEKVNLATGLYEDLVKLQEVLKNNQVVLQYRAVLVDLSKTFEQGARAIQESLAVERSRMEIFKGQGYLKGVPEGLDIPDIKGYTRTKMTASERVFADNPAAVALAQKIKELEITKSGTAEQVYSADKALVALQSIQSVSKGFGAALAPGDLSKYTETVARTGDVGIAELKLDTNRMVGNTAATVERLDAILANISGISEINTLAEKFDKGGMSPEAIENTLEKVARVREKASDTGDTDTVVAANTLLDKLSQQLAAAVGVEKSIKMVEGNMTLFSKQYTGQEQAQRVFGGLGANQLVGELKDVLPQERKWLGLRAVEGQPTFEKDVSSLKSLQEKNAEEQLISSKNIIKAASASSVLNAFQTRTTNKTLDKYNTGINEKVTDLEKARGAGDEGAVNKLVKELSAMTELRDKEQNKADFSGTVRNLSVLTSGSMQFAKAMGLTETQIKVLGVGSVGLYSAVKLTSKIMGEELPESAKAFEEALRSATEAVAKGEKPSVSTILKAKNAGKKMEDEFPGKAAGGLITGAGTGISDDIMAMVSNGEYVIKASSASKLGRNRLDFMNKRGELPKFASGGPVGEVDEVTAIKHALAQQEVINTVKIDNTSVNRLAQVLAATLASTVSGYVAEQNTENTKIATAASKASDEAAKIADIIKTNSQASQAVFDKYFSPVAKGTKTPEAAGTEEQSLVLDSRQEFKKVSENIEKMRGEMIAATKEMSEEAAKAHKSLLDMRFAEEIKMETEAANQSLQELKLDRILAKSFEDIKQQGILSKLFTPDFLAGEPDRAVSTQGLMAGKYSPVTDISLTKRTFADLSSTELMMATGANINRPAESPFEDIAGKFKYAASEGGLGLKRDPLFDLPYKIEGSISKAFKAFMTTNLRQRTAEEQFTKIDDISQEKSSLQGRIKKYSSQRYALSAQGEDTDLVDEQLSKLKGRLEELNKELGTLIYETAGTAIVFRQATKNYVDAKDMFVKHMSENISRQFSTQSLYGPESARGAVDGLEFANSIKDLSTSQRVWAGADNETRDLITGYKRSTDLLGSIASSLQISREKEQEAIITKTTPGASEGAIKTAEKQIVAEKLVQEQLLKRKDATTELAKVMHDGISALYTYTDVMTSFNRGLDAIRLGELVQDMTGYKEALEAQKKVLGSGSYLSPEFTSFEERREATKGGTSLGLTATPKEREVASLRATIAQSAPGQDISDQMAKLTFLTNGQYELEEKAKEYARIAAEKANKTFSLATDYAQSIERAIETGQFTEEEQASMRAGATETLAYATSYATPVEFEEAIKMAEQFPEDVANGFIASMFEQYRETKGKVDKYYVSDPGRIDNIKKIQSAAKEDIQERMRSRAKEIATKTGDLTRADMQYLKNGASADAVKIDVLKQIAVNTAVLATDVDKTAPGATSGPSGIIPGILDSLSPKYAFNKETKKLELIPDDQRFESTFIGAAYKFSDIISSAIFDALTDTLSKVGNLDFGNNKKASGGFISGNGGPKEDNIPTMLSNGEYVIKADSTSKLGKQALDYINTTGSLPGFAEGGKVTAEQELIYRNLYNMGFGYNYGIPEGEAFDAEKMHAAATSASKPVEEKESSFFSKVKGYTSKGIARVKTDFGSTIKNQLSTLGASLTGQLTAEEMAERTKANKELHDTTLRKNMSKYARGGAVENAVEEEFAKKGGISSLGLSRYMDKHLTKGKHSKLDDMLAKADQSFFGKDMSGKKNVFTNIGFDGIRRLNEEDDYEKLGARKEGITGTGTIISANRTISTKDIVNLTDQNKKRVNAIAKGLYTGDKDKIERLQRPVQNAPKNNTQSVFGSLISSAKNYLSTTDYGKSATTAVQNAIDVINDPSQKGTQAKAAALSLLRQFHSNAGAQRKAQLTGNEGLYGIDAGKRKEQADSRTAYKALIQGKQSDMAKKAGYYNFLEDPEFTGAVVRNKKALGGRIMSTFGSGGPKEDNIPALLSSGEYVINAHAAAKLGDSALEYLNKTGNIPKFAEGGKAGALTFDNNSLNNNNKIELDASDAADLITKAIEDAKLIIPELKIEDTVLTIEEEQRTLIAPDLVIAEDQRTLIIPEIVMPEGPTLKLPEFPELKVSVPEIIISESNRTMIVPDSVVEVSLSDNKVYLQDNKVEISNIDAITAAMSSNNVGADINNDLAELVREMKGRVDVLEELPEQIEMLAGANIRETLDTMRSELELEQNSSLRGIDTTINNLRSDLDNMRQKQTGLSNRVTNISSETELKLRELNTTVYSMRK